MDEWVWDIQTCDEPTDWQTHNKKWIYYIKRIIFTRSRTPGDAKHAFGVDDLKSEDLQKGGTDGMCYGYWDKKSRIFARNELTDKVMFQEKNEKKRKE